MINKLKYFYLLAVCAIVFGNVSIVSAQSNSQIYADKAIQYYEWLFETEFSGEQRRQYREIKAEDFRSDAEGEKKGIEQMMTNFAAVKAKSESEGERIRGTVMSSFINDLRNMSDSAEAQFLLSVYDAKQTADAADADANGTGDISAYVGKWVWSRTGGGVVSNSGVWMGGNGSRFTYEFSPNGDVQFTGIMNVMQGGCSQQVFQSRKGKASVSGNNLTISWQPEKYTRDFSCDTANNYTKTMPAKVEKLKVNFRNDAGQKQMCFVGAECFSPSR